MEDNMDIIPGMLAGVMEYGELESDISVPQMLAQNYIETFLTEYFSKPVDELPTYEDALSNEKLHVSSQNFRDGQCIVIDIIAALMNKFRMSP